MEELWLFFENMDEMVYVSDMETCAILYMNRRLRGILGYHSHEAYAGRPCCEVLQGSGIPCGFCGGQRLRPGEFLSRIHEDPVLGRRFLIKDTMVLSGDRRCRLEIAITLEPEAAPPPSSQPARGETILQQCLRHSLALAEPGESIRNMLAYIGEAFSCDRVCIFEASGSDTVRSTYEWQAEEVLPGKDLPREAPLSAIRWWLPLLAQGEAVVIPDLEEIRVQHPETAALLRQRGVASLAAGPITADGRPDGFLGLENPDSRMLPCLPTLLHVIGYFISALLKRRDLMDRLHELSYRDQLTGAYNRHALAEQFGSLPMDSVGVVYCDVTGLKQINDCQGHAAGDRLLLHCFRLIRRALDTDLVYRAGGDEFIALCPNCGEDAFQNQARRLRKAVLQDRHHIAVGEVWSDQKPLELERLISQADQVMYREKRRYYRENGHRPGVDRRRGDRASDAE